MKDVLIIGGGPAGLNAALYAARKEMSVALVTGTIGGQLTNTKEIENYLGFGSIDAYELIQKFEEQVKAYPIDWRQTMVEELRQEEDGTFTAVLFDGNSIQGRTCILATGQERRRLGIPGEDELAARGVSYCTTCDGPMFRNKRVCIVGGGDSAVEAAIEMTSIASEVHLLVRSRLRADEILIHKMRSTGKVQEWHHVIPTEVIGEKRVAELCVRNTDTNEESRIALDGIFVEIGGCPTMPKMPEQLERNENNEVMVAADGATNIPGLYAAGDVNNYPQKQIIIAAADGAKAALAAYAYLLHRR